MAGRGETVKYVIEADTSDFSRGMAGAATQAEVAGRRIDRSLSSTSKRTENNFQDMRRNAATAASSIRNFGVAFQAFNTTSAIIGVTALAGAFIELAGAVTAAGSTFAIIAPILAQGVAATSAFKSGVFGLSDAFAAIGKNDGKAFADSLSKLGPAATQVAYSVIGLNQAMNSIRLNTQQALLEGIGDTLTRLGANVLPTVNRGFQIIGQSMNRAFKEAAALTGSPAFSGLLATIFSDTARTIDTLSGAIAPLLTIFTNLYAITAPYVQLLSEFVVNLSKSGAAYLSSAKGQSAFNLSLMYGVIALQQLGALVSSIFGLLSAVFRSSVVSGTSLITTLTGIINEMTAWVNTAEGQAKLAALFQFTSITIQAVANALGTAINIFLGFVQVFSSINPQLQSFIVGMLASSLVIRPVISYIGQLYLAFRVLAVYIFNVAEQALIVARAIGLLSSVAIIAAVGLIYLGSVIRGPIGSSLIIVGGIIAAYIGLNYLLGIVAASAAPAIASTGVAGAAAGTGLGFAARGAIFLQTALLPLLVLAAGVLVLLSMLGVFSGKAQSAGVASKGLGSSLSGLNKSLKGVGNSGGNAATGGLADLNSSLGDVGTAASEAQNSLAGFDKMNVLTDSSASGAGIGVPKVPSLPAPDFGGVGGGGLALPDLDTGSFDDAFGDLNKQFADLDKKFKSGFSNPFDEIGKFINANPVPFLIAFAVVLGVIVALFATGAVTIGLATLPLTLIVIGIIAIIAIIILLVKNWETVWGAITTIVSGFGEFIVNIFKGVSNFIVGILKGIGNFFTTAFNNVVNFMKEWGPTILALMFLPFSILLGLLFTFKEQIFGFFQAIANFIVAVISPIGEFFGSVFRLAWEGVKFAFSFYVGFFTGLWNGLVSIFSPVAQFFSNMFGGAVNAIKNAFSSIGGFFQGVWNSIVSIFGSVGVAVGNAIGGAVKSVVNSVLNTVANVVNTVIDVINGAIESINKLPGVKVSRVGRVALPRLAKGGVVTSSTFAEIGEAGAEAVVPLENNTQWMDKIADKINSRNNSPVNPNGTDLIPVTNKRDEAMTNHFEINVSGVFATSPQEQKKVADLIMKQINSTMRAKGQQKAF